MEPEPCQSEAPEGTVPQSGTQQQESAAGLALAAKVNVVRLILAYAGAVMLHFQLLAATTDSRGLIDKDSMTQVVFIYCRLQMLLLPHERKKLDQALSVSR